MLFLIPAWVLLAYVASNLIIAGLLWLLNVAHVPLDEALRPAVFQTVVAATVYILSIAIAIGVPYAVKQRKTTLETLGMTRLPSWSDIGLAPVTFIAYLLVVTTIVALITVWFPGFQPDQAQDIGFSVFGSRLDNMLAFLTLVVLAPIAEEVLFRGYLYGKLKRHIPVIWAAIATSLLFGLVHLQWNVGVDVFILSLFLCGLRSLTGSIWAGVLVHMIKNGIAYYILFNPLIG